jgi:hypothetical protein
MFSKIGFQTLYDPEFWVFVKGECQEFSVKAVKVFLFFATSFLYETASCSFCHMVKTSITSKCGR